MEVNVRRLTEADCSAVKMIEKNMLEEYKRILAETGGKDDPLPFITPRYFKEYTSKEGSFMAEAEGMPVGYILTKAVPFMHGEERTVWMEQVAVLGGFRKEGVGGKLLEAVEDWARRKKMKLLYATLSPKNQASKGLLASRGFEVQDWTKASKTLSE